MDLDEALEEWLKSVKKIAELTPKEQAEITGAGAKKYAEILTETTREKHYSHHDDKVYGHMADHVTYQKKNIDGQTTGVSSVGWDNHYHAMNAQRLNDGTKHIQADHFKTNLDNNEEVAQQVLEAEKAKYDEVIK